MPRSAAASRGLQFTLPLGGGFAIVRPLFLDVPTVTAPRASSVVRMPASVRWWAASAAILGATLLATARGLEPDPRGYGTHEQLGLSPCLFQQWTNHVCPSCGITTAWAYAMRGDLRRAAAANVAGLLLWALTLAAVPWLLLAAIAGRWLLMPPTWPLVLGVGAVWIMVAVFDWLRRLQLG